MGHEQLERIVDLLPDVEAADWLKRKLQKLVEPTGGPWVLVVVSAKREMQQAFPEGLALGPNCTEGLDEESPSVTDEAVMEHDLIIWGMSALRMFPGECSLVLESANSKGVPIWAVITGLGLVGDKERFRKEVIPSAKRRLPEKSQIFLHGIDVSQDTLATIANMLEEKGKDLAISGYERRKAAIIKEFGARLNDNRQELRKILSRANSRMETARRGLEALEIVAVAYPNELVAQLGGVMTAMDRLPKDMERWLDSLTQDVDEMTLKKKIEEMVSTFQGVELESEFERIRNLLMGGISDWSHKATQELHNFFDPLADLGNVAEKLGVAAEVDQGKFSGECDQIFQSWRRQALDEFQNLTRRLETDFWLQLIRILGKDVLGNRSATGKNQPARMPLPQPGKGSLSAKGQVLRDALENTRLKVERQQLLSLFSESINETKQSLRELTGKAADRLKSVLMMTLERHAEACLSLCEPSLEAIEGTLRRMEQAEDLLKKV